MSASLRESGPFPSPPITSFYAQCAECRQVGLFATVDGFLACDWRLKDGSESSQTTRNGLFILRATCSRCRIALRAAKSALRRLK